MTPRNKRTNKLTMRKFDSMCLTPIPRLKPTDRDGSGDPVFFHKNDGDAEE